MAVRVEGDALVFITDQGDEAAAGPDHAIVVETDPATGEPAPRVHVRGDLWARIARPVFYEMVERALVRALHVGVPTVVSGNPTLFTKCYALTRRK